MRDRGALAVRAAPPLRGIASLAVTPDPTEDHPLPATLMVEPVVPNRSLATVHVAEMVPALPIVTIATPQVAPVVTAGQDAMTQRGELWEISYQQRRGVIPDCRGLQYLALLVRDTGGGRDPIHAKELSARATGETASTVELDMDDAVLDAKARTQLMERLEELAVERDRAIAVDDLARATRLDDEYEQIADELGRAGAKRGASRHKTAFVHAGEKARKAVAKAIASAIAKIAEHPELSPLAAHFTSTVRKGQWLSYTGSVDWHVDVTTPLPRK